MLAKLTESVFLSRYESFFCIYSAYLPPLDLCLGMETWIVMSWWEPCRIKVSPNCLLPDTVCGKCMEEIENCHAFIKKSLHNIIILETQFSIQQSCLKAKQKHDKSCYTDFDHKKDNKGIQTEDYLNILSGRSFDVEDYLIKFPETSKYLEDLHETAKNVVNLVGYDIDSDDSESLSNNNGEIYLSNSLNLLSNRIPPTESVICNNDTKIKVDYGCDHIERFQPKICEINVSKRKSKVPKKIDAHLIEDNDGTEDHGNLVQSNILSPTSEQDEEGSKYESGIMSPLRQNCLLCDVTFPNAAMLATHVSEFHDIDIAEVVSSEFGDVMQEKRKKKLPNLVKISDLKRTDGYDDRSLNNQHEEPPRLLPSFVCSNCPGEFTNKSDLLMHSQLKHAQQAAYLCGLCTQQCTSLENLQKHLQLCSSKQKISDRFICNICKYSDDNMKSLENHVIVHNFLIDDCRKQTKIFDPEDYIDINENFDSTNTTNFTCIDCGNLNFETFKEFSNHKRNQHSIYHCDLCNKCYGRNSHLWKHVNKIHKDHPSITCQLCYKTSASKYHLAQHFKKTHLVKGVKQKLEDVAADKVEPLEQQSTDHTGPNRSNESDEEEAYLPMNLIKLEVDEEAAVAPKEIDPSHDLYNNIITNYTPPLNGGEFKCHKCSKGFNKKAFLKKHKRNCRPKLQKDLLTRCKSCSRLFKDRQSLTKHLVNYHSDYFCEICNQKVQSKCAIISHIRFQHPECDLICKICKNVLRSRQDMQEHLNNHIDSHICQFCGDNLPSKIKLKMHILSLHRKMLSLSCGICLKLFENQHFLKDHVSLLHKDQLVPFISCRVCGKNYASKWKTYDHINKSHGKIFKACRVCLEVFNNDAQLQAHCDVTSHGPSSGLNTTALRDTIMAIVKNVVQQHTENNNDNVDELVNEDVKYDTVIPQHFLAQDDTQATCLEKSVPAKRNFDDEGATARTTKKLKTDLTEAISEAEYPQTNLSKRTVYINGNDPSYCEICYKSWPAKKHLWQHYIRCHKSVAATVCGICLKTNDSYEGLQKHLQENHPKLLHGQGFGSNFICKICGRYHNASSKLRLHMGIHANFDWNLLENKSSKMEKNVGSEFMANVGRQQEVINYESLIEQVECSSNSEDDDLGIGTDRMLSSKEDVDNYSSCSLFSDDELDEQ